MADSLTPKEPSVLPTGPEVYYWREVGDLKYPKTGAVQNIGLQVDRVKVNDDKTNPMKLSSKIVAISGRVNTIAAPMPSAEGQPKTPEEVYLAERLASTQKFIAAKGL